MMSLHGRESEALIRIFFHRPKSNLHKKATSAVTKTVSEPILYMLEGIKKFPPMMS